MSYYERRKKKRERREGRECDCTYEKEQLWCKLAMGMWFLLEASAEDNSILGL